MFVCFYVKNKIYKYYLQKVCDIVKYFMIDY